MSRGQKPRRPQFFPRMKYRARKRYRGRVCVTFYDGLMFALWPQPIKLDRFDLSWNTNRVGGGVATRSTPPSMTSGNGSNLAVHPAAEVTE